MFYEEKTLRERSASGRKPDRLNGYLFIEKLEPYHAWRMFRENPEKTEKTKYIKTPDKPPLAAAILEGLHWDWKKQTTQKCGNFLRFVVLLLCMVQARALRASKGRSRQYFRICFLGYSLFCFFESCMFQAWGFSEALSFKSFACSFLRRFSFILSFWEARAILSFSSCANGCS